MSGDNVTLNANRHFSTLGIKCPSGFDFSFFQGIVKDFLALGCITFTKQEV